MQDEKANSRTAPISSLDDVLPEFIRNSDMERTRFKLRLRAKFHQVIRLKAANIEDNNVSLHPGRFDGFKSVGKNFYLSTMA
jgi:hypothetical protein